MTVKLTLSGRGQAGLLAFCVPGRAQENNHGGELHPDQQADDSSQPPVDDGIGHFANVITEKHVNKPPQESRDGCAGQDVPEAVLLWTGKPVNERKGNKRKEHGGQWEKYGPQTVERVRWA